jgi:hypothetical protein
MRRGMMGHQPGRFVVCAGLVIATSLAVALPSGVAVAKKPKPVTGTCSGLRGGAAQQTLSGCTDPAETGGGGTSTITSDTINGKKATSTDSIAWASGRTSTEASSNTLKSGKADKCHPSAGETNLYEVKEKGRITGGTVTDLVGGKTKATVCVFTVTNGVVTTLFPGSSDTF